jgi:hypothetical protein
MTKRLPPRSDDPQIASPDEVAAAGDADPLVELVETGRAVARGPVGLAFGISLDVRPVQAFCEALARAIELADADVSKREAAVEKRERALAPKKRRRQRLPKP